MTHALPIVWAIGGHDNTGRAGLAADLQVAQALNVHMCPIVTMVTAQNDAMATVQNAVSPGQLIEQCRLALSLGQPSAIKIGAINKAQRLALADWLVSADLSKTNIIWDPVTHSSTGHMLGEWPDTEDCPQWWRLIDWITPNLNELSELTRIIVDDLASRTEAMAVLRATGIPNVLVTGGHQTSSHVIVDSWQDREGLCHFETPRHPASNLRGTGCRIASLLACHLARGSSPGDAVVRALMCLNHAIREPVSLPEGYGYPAPSTLTPDGASLPKLVDDSRWRTSDPVFNFRPVPRPIGLYPIVDSIEQLKRLAPFDLQLVQLRIKKPLAACAQEIQAACAWARTHHIRLIINDHWQAAITYGAFGVHLGQEDLPQADLAAIENAGLALGISTHDYFELVRALSRSPSYVALGHIFPTPTKVMPSSPQGLTRLREYVQLNLDVPTVAIGGIDRERAQAVAATGVDGIAVVRAVSQATDLASTVAYFQSLFKRR